MHRRLTKAQKPGGVAGDVAGPCGFTALHERLSVCYWPTAENLTLAIGFELKRSTC